MQIDVEIFGQLGAGVQRRQTLILERSMHVRDIADRLGLNLEEVGLIVIDGVLSKAEDYVLPGSRLCFFPPMSGG